MEYFVAGYYLVEGIEHRPWLNSSLLPHRYWSISSCICTIYPDPHFLSWVRSSEQQLVDIREKLALDADDFALLQQHVDHLFNTETLQWPNVWAGVEDAQTFYTRYLTHIPHIKLLGIALPSRYLTDLLEESKPANDTQEASGTYTNLTKKDNIPHHSNRLGFEILGHEIGSSFHSFACNGLENDYISTLGIHFNQYGYIGSIEDAIRASDYTNLDTTAAEPVLWTPWLVFEQPLH